MTFPRLQISIATVMMMVITVAAASALAARVVRQLGLVASIPPIISKYDLAAVLLLGISSTGVALAARQGHSPNQAMLQIGLACLGLLYAISMFEVSSPRVQLYWLQALFATLVVGPLVARRVIKNRLDRSPRRTWWLKTCEAVAFAYLNLLIVFVGIVIEATIFFSF